MTREDLVERITLALAQRQGFDAAQLEGKPFLAMMYRRDAVACLPVVVEVVAEWIAQQGQVASAISSTEASSLAATWREAMEP